jgi:hypothetical protein
MSCLVDHLLLGCVYSREFWFKAPRRCGWQRITPSSADTLGRMVALSEDAHPPCSSQGVQFVCHSGGLVHLGGA